MEIEMVYWFTLGHRTVQTTFYMHKTEIDKTNLNKNQQQFEWHACNNLDIKWQKTQMKKQKQKTVDSNTFVEIFFHILNIKKKYNFYQLIAIHNIFFFFFVRRILCHFINFSW